MTYTVSSGTLNSTIPYHTLPNVDRFSKFTSRLSSKRAMKWSLKIPTHLKCVATLPCEMCPETINNLKVLSCSSKENFNVLTDLCHCEYSVSSCSSNADMETSAPLVSGIVSTTLVFHFSSHISQTLHQVIHILHFCLVDSSLNYAPNLVVSWIDVKAVRRPQIWKFIGGDHDLLDYCTFRVEAANYTRNVWVNTACGKDHS